MIGIQGRAKELSRFPLKFHCDHLGYQIDQNKQRLLFLSWPKKDVDCGKLTLWYSSWLKEKSKLQYSKHIWFFVLELSKSLVEV